ncbi:hypothetical protein DFH06DRAFT_486008 [Mycena polygramma]|nr:hypothetical protein DFH06DRAFT_486008 [Mycena polygramma]
MAFLGIPLACGRTIIWTTRIDWTPALQNYAAPLGPSVKTAKKPSVGTFKVESSPYSSSAAMTSSPAPSSRSRRPSQQPPQPSRAELPEGSRRRTINSMTSHTLVYNERIPPPNTELRIPDPPSRSPSPPTEIIPHNRGGHKFTPGDRAYFIKFIQWRLKGDPTLVRSELCDLLAEKAPHHSAQSWASYWQSHHDLPDKILASMREEAEDNESSGDEEKKPPKPKKLPVVRRKPNYKETSSESELTEDSEEDEAAEEEKEEEETDVNDDDLEIPPFDESGMGLKGGPFTKSDLGVVARHVASFPDFSDTSMQEKWADFTRRYPQRALKSWNEYYRRNQKTIDKLAKKIRKLKASERERPVTPPPPRPAPLPRPTWAAPEHNGPPRAKRKFGDGELENGEAKRLRPEGIRLQY